MQVNIANAPIWVQSQCKLKCKLTKSLYINKDQTTSFQSYKLILQWLTPDLAWLIQTFEQSVSD